MVKCIYKSESDNKCCRSTSDHHCEEVDDTVCSKCLLHQDKPTVSKETLIKAAITNAILALKDNDVEYAMELLGKAKKI